MSFGITGSTTMPDVIKEHQKIGSAAFRVGSISLDSQRDKQQTGDAEISGGEYAIGR